MMLVILPEPNIYEKRNFIYILKAFFSAVCGLRYVLQLRHVFMSSSQHTNKIYLIRDIFYNTRKNRSLIFHARTGGVDRKTARGGTTGGERYVRVRPTLGAPRYLWFGSDKVIVRQLTEHETGTMNSIARRKSFRSQIKLNLKMADPSTSPSSSAAGDESCKENSGVGIPVNGSVRSTTTVTAVSAQHGFR